MTSRDGAGHRLTSTRDGNSTLSKSFDALDVATSGKWSACLRRDLHSVIGDATSVITPDGYRSIGSGRLVGRVCAKGDHVGVAIDVKVSART